MPRATKRSNSRRRRGKISKKRNTAHTVAVPRAMKASSEDCPKCGTEMVGHISCPKCHYSPDTAYSSLHEAKEFTHPG